MKYLILGRIGQLGLAFCKYLISKGKEFLALSEQECDISDLKTVLKVFESYRPDVVINCAAYNYVDKAEFKFFNAYGVNALGVSKINLTVILLPILQITFLMEQKRMVFIQKKICQIL